MNPDPNAPTERAGLVRHEPCSLTGRSSDLASRALADLSPTGSGALRRPNEATGMRDKDDPLAVHIQNVYDTSPHGLMCGVVSCASIHPWDLVQFLGSPEGGRMCRQCYDLWMPIAIRIVLEEDR